MQHIKIDSNIFREQAQFIKDNTPCTTLTAVVKKAIENYYFKVKEDKRLMIEAEKSELERQLKELEK